MNAINAMAIPKIIRYLVTLYSPKFLGMIREAQRLEKSAEYQNIASSQYLNSNGVFVLETSISQREAV